MSNYTVEDTRVVKDHWGKWKAKTAVLFAGEVKVESREDRGQRVLNISTYKTDRGILITNASIAVRGADFEITVVSFGGKSFGGKGDFSKRVYAEPVKMANEKRIREQHAQAVAQIPALAAEAEAYYAATTVDA